MIEKKIILNAFVIILFMIVVGCKEISSEELAGKYINTNFEYTPFIPEIPYVEDTLVLKENLSFSSDHFGQGKYKILNGFLGSGIEFTYNYEMGKASFRTVIEKDQSGYPKIVLFKQEDHYYQKIE